MFRIIVDQGGTFADGVLVDEEQQLTVAKAETNPEDPASSIMNCIIQLAKECNLSESNLLANTTSISIGTTLGTNAILEEKGARCCLLHTKGFRDTFELGRTIPKQDIYNLKLEAPRVLIPRYLRFGIEERIQHDGQEVTPLNENDVIAAVKKAKDYRVEIPVVCFLHSYINPSHEERAAEIIRADYPNVIVSSQILRRWIEYDRLSTATFAAYVKPLFTRFVQTLQNRLEQAEFQGTLLFGTALGDVTTAELALENPANVIASGVANGALMGRFLAEQSNLKNIVNIDMGGTSADISVLQDRIITTTTDTVIGGQKNAIESMDITSIGAGGGSIAWLDRLGVLQVGPESTGASPGPACYGKGGRLPAITDADVVLGYIPSDYFLGGTIKLQQELAEKAIKENIADPLGISTVAAAYAIASLAEATMAERIFLSVVEKGYSPRDFVLVAGGGAGPVHAINIARRLGMKQVYIPKHAAVFAALGGIVADYGYMINRFLYRRDDLVDLGEMQELYQAMEKEAIAIFNRQGVSAQDMTVVRGAEMRYLGQLRDISVTLSEINAGEMFTEASLQELIATFHQRHEELYGWGDNKLPALIALLKLRAIAKRHPFSLTKQPLSNEDPKQAVKRKRQTYFQEGAGFTETPCYDEKMLRPGNIVSGPAIIEEAKTTLVVPPNCTVMVDSFQNYLATLPAD